MEKVKEFLSISSGYGSGDGYGSGSGDGDGYGSGDGDGYGSGDGYKSINGKAIYTIDNINTIIKSVRNNIAKGYILNRDLTLQKCFIVKQGDNFAHGENLKEAQKSLIDKLLIDMPEEERIEAFKKEFQMNKKYKGSQFFDWHYRLTGSCEMGRRSFVKDNGIDLEKKFSVHEFVEMTKESYGGEIISKLKEIYENDR